jgi:hypothetical protein
VIELQKLKDTFIDPLLHPYSASPLGSPHHFDYLDEPAPRSDSPLESLDHLPIAARFLGPSTLGPGGGSDSEDEAEALDTLGPAPKKAHPRSPYRATLQAPPRAGGTPATTRSGNGVAFPSRSHHSLPPPARAPDASTASLGRSAASPPQPNTGSGGRAAAGAVLRKFKKSNPAPPQDGLAPGGGVAPHLLPEHLRRCLEVIEGAIIEGHNALSKGLRKRYDEQYPLVRSLADVFVAHSHILHGYATYVLHLERALAEVDAALSTAAAAALKKPKKASADDWSRTCAHLRRLEESAAERGETGLAISLSKPFQRLLKYPLLFQNLLYHTDPSTFEYESTLQMVAEVETIVRSIEDEKIQKEERDRTRDVFARIDGLGAVRQLALPKPSRLLVEERALLGAPSPPPSAGNGGAPPGKAVKGKTSLKRLSDVLGGGSGGIGGKKDLWLVVFNDVVLRCQRIGQTSLPLASAPNTRTTSMPDLQGKSKYATTGRRHSQTKPRNLYKFLKVGTCSRR